MSTAKWIKNTSATVVNPQNSTAITPGKLLPQPNYQARSAQVLARFAPLIAISCYLTFTVFLFAFGPWKWPVRNPFQLYPFLFLSQVALVIGYTIGALRQARGYYGRWSPTRLITFSLVMNLVMLLPTTLTRTGSLIPNVIEGIQNPGVVYYANNMRMAEGGNFVEYIRIILGPILILYFPLAIFFWQKISLSLKLGTFFVTVWTAAGWIAIGTNKGIADFVILLPLLVGSSYLAGVFRLNRRVIVIFASAAAVLLVAFFMFFTTGNTARTGGGVFYMETADVGVDVDYAPLRFLPNNVFVGVSALTGYITQGYYGLSLSMQQPFIPNYGIGNSMFLYRNAAKLLGRPDLESRPYPARLQGYGWDAYGNWSSIYPWIASDVSFPGTIVVVFIIGYLFARVWIDALVTKNPFAVVMYAQLCIMLFYFSANNQLLQSGEGLFAFIGTFLAWAFTRRKFTMSAGKLHYGSTA
jgi:hypothetical protein